MTADHDDLIREAEEKLAEANAEVARLRAQLATEQADEQRLLTAEDGRAEARRRHPARFAASTDAGTGDAEGQTPTLTGAAAGVARCQAPWVGPR